MEIQNGELFLKRRIDGFKFLNRKAKKKAKNRINEIENISRELYKHQYFLTNHNDFPRIEFMGAVEKYLLGFYYESLQNSFNSVEFALLVKLNDVISDKEKHDIRERINTTDAKPLSFTFGYMKSLAEKYGIAKEKNVMNKLNYITNIRNSIFHPVNIMNVLIMQQQSFIPEFEDYMKKYEAIKEKKIMRFIPVFKTINTLAGHGKTALESTELFDWCIPKKSTTFLHGEVSQIIQEYFAQANKLKEEIESDPLKSIKLIEYSKSLKDKGIMKRLSHITINIAFEILQYLDVF